MGTKLHEGFFGALPQTENDIRDGLRGALVSIDANVLLSFYRYSPKARDALTDVLRALDDRLFVSHQAAREFWRNRMNAIDDRTAATEDFVGSVEKQQRAMESALAAWAKQTALPEEMKARIEDQIESAVAEVRTVVESQVSSRDRFGYGADEDTIVQLLRRIVDEKVGPPLPEKDHAAALQEAARRVRGKIPPGFRDAEKEDESGPDGAAGDYLVWRQSLDEAKRRGLALVLVTGDEKDDWWWKHRNVFLGPRTELVVECHAEIGASLVMLRPINLIENASALDVSVSPEAVSDIALKSATVPDAQWNRRALAELFERLETEGWTHGQFIVEAAQNGGVIGRERIFEIAGYDASRQLKGFTRPPTRITNDLQRENLLDGGVSSILVPRYHGGVVAQDFVIPEEVTDMLTDGRPLRGRARLVDESGSQESSD